VPHLNNSDKLSCAISKVWKQITLKQYAKTQFSKIKTVHPLVYTLYERSWKTNVVNQVDGVWGH